MLPLHYSINLTGFFSNAEALTSATLLGSDSFLWHDNVVVVLMPAACDSHGAALSHLLHTSTELCLQCAWLQSPKSLLLAGKGPIDNLFDHIANPGQVNFATNGVSLPFIRR